MEAQAVGANPMPDTDTTAGTPLAPNAGTDTSQIVSTAGGRFATGFDPRRNVAGRIPKKPTVFEETQKLATRRRKRIAKAWVDTMEGTDAAANRARADYNDRDIGTVAHRMIVAHGEVPADALYEEIRGMLTGELPRIETNDTDIVDDDE